MKKISLKMKNFSRKDIDFIVAELKKGKIIAYPTDTIYGLGCDATNQIAINKIYKIKKRPKTKPMLVLVSGFEMLKKYFIADKDQLDFLKQIWPGPVTAILKAKKILSDNLKAHDQSAGVRFPKNIFLIELINKLNRPLVSTSLNIGGEKNIDNVSKMEKYFTKSSLPDIAIDAGKLPINKPSTLIDLKNICNIKILRK
jgi:L-threonylcarbamoyladenylate synthase